MNMINVIVVIAAIGCMLLAQSKSMAQRDRRIFSLLGSAASIIVAFEAGQRGDMGTLLLFACATAASLVGVVYSYLRPSNPDA